MNVVILGAGRVGGRIAEMLSGESDITVIDADGARLRELQNHLDIRTIHGNAAHPSVLREAGCEDAEMIIAVTAKDEVNLVACKICASVFNVPTKIARIRSREFGEHPELFDKENFNITHTFCPEDIVTEAIVNPIRHPGSLALHYFGGGAVALAVVRVSAATLNGNSTIDVLQKKTPQDFRIVAVYRDKFSITPMGNTRLSVGDEVFVVAAANDIRAVILELSGADEKSRRIIIAGGGNIGQRLAGALEDDCDVKIIEKSRARCAELSQILSRALVLCGDSTDEALLSEEGVKETDIFCAVTNDDEDNIMSALLAKRLGARKVAVLINRSAYVDLLRGHQIDIAISPSQLTIGSLLTHIRRGEVAAVHSLRRGDAEAMETVARGDAKTSSIVGRRNGDINWPQGAMLGAIAREGGAVIAHDDTVIESGDHLVIFLSGKREIAKVEKLLAVGLQFF